jgi:hypothetical protein
MNANILIQIARERAIIAEAEKRIRLLETALVATTGAHLWANKPTPPPKVIHKL